MLEYLRIRNLALIEDVELDLAPGLNVLTGETGAGKSFILKALNFLTGDKLSADMIRPEQDKAQVEAVFVLPDAEYALRRELVAETGRSRMFVNDALGSQDSIKSLRPSMILHVGQHGQQRLLQPAYQTKILDSFVEDHSSFEQKEQLLRELKQLETSRNELEDKMRSLEDKRELLEYQRQEIEKVSPVPGEEDALEERKKALKSQEQAKESLTQAMDLLYAPENGLLDGLSRLERSLTRLADVLPELEDGRALVEEQRYQLSELAGRLKGERLLDAEEDDLEKIEARLWQLAQLKRKLKRPLEAIIRLESEITENLSFLDSCGLERKRLEKQEKALLDNFAAALKDCNAIRRSAGEKLVLSLQEELKGLGFSEHVRVICEFSQATPLPNHPELEEDRPRFLWQPNPGQPPQPLDKIASGGELSRFLLAVSSLAAKADLPTLIFDEVDAGVGGVTLQHVADRLQELSKRQQVILITHWPQLASRADRHFLITKDVVEEKTITDCKQLNGKDIRMELSRMAGGGSQGEAMARELLSPVTVAN